MISIPSVVSYKISLTPATSGAAIVNQTFTPSPTSTTTYTVTGLTPGESYTATVQAVSSGVSSSVSTASLPQRTDPPTPTNVQLSQPTVDQTTSLKVNWDMISTPFIVSSYKISLIPESSGAAIVTKTYPANATSTTTYTVTGLNPGESFTATVQAFSSAVSSSVSTPSLSQRTGNKLTWLIHLALKQVLQGIEVSLKLEDVLYNPPTPTGITLSRSTGDQTTSLTLRWNMSTPFVVSSYEISLTSDTSGATVTETYTANATSPLTYTVTGLTPGESYTATVQAVSSGVSSSISTASLPQRTDPPTPTNVQLSQPTVNQTTSLKVDWDMISIPSVVSYKISLTPATSGAAIVNQTFTPSPTSTTTYTVTGLTPGESYTATVQAVSSGVSGSVSTASNPQRTDLPTPTGVTLSQSTGDQTTSLTLSWNMSTPFVVSSYEISLTSDTSGAAVTETYTANATSPLTYTVTGLTPGESYTATVQAVSSGVSGSVSTASPPQRTDPPTPTGVILSQSTGDQTTSLKVDWVMISIPSVVSYKISLTPSTSGAAIVNQTFTPSPTSTTTYTVTGLTPGESYTATVQAVSSGVSGSVSTPSLPQRTDPPTPTSVQLSQPTVNQTTSLKVDWDMISIPSVASYKISLTPSTSGAAIVNQTFTPSPISTTTYTITGLTPGESYTATVQAVSSSVPGSVSIPSLPQRTDPPTPTNVQLSQPTGDQTTSLKVDWVMISTPFIVSSYNISLIPESSGAAIVNQTFTPLTSATTDTVIGLTPGESYTATVQAVSSGVSGTNSDASPSLRTGNKLTWLTPLALKQMSQVL
ncbi:fibronectin-like [Ciona intestinalis]